MSNATTSNRCRGALAALTLAWAASGAAAPAMTRGVVLDAERHQVLLMRPEGGIEAIDVKTGDIRWTSPAGDLPILVHEGRLVALRDQDELGVVALAVIDAQTGAEVAHQNGRLPAPARALVDDRLDERFEVEPLPAGHRFAWRYVSEPVRGASLGDAERALGSTSAQETAPARVELTGTLSVDLTTAAASVDVDPRPAHAVAAIETTELAAAGGRRFLSAGATHILASEREQGEQYRWRIYSRGGARLGEVSTPYAYLPFAVVDDVLVYATPLRFDRVGQEAEMSPISVVATVLGSGPPLWRRALRDTAYRGPYPH